MRNTSGLIPWKPGQSGNPRGGSARKRRQKRLREAMLDAINSGVPAKIVKRLEGEGIGLPDTPELLAADIIAIRTVLDAISGTPAERHNARACIASLEPKQLEHSGSLDRPAPQLETDDPSLDEVASILDDAGALH